LPTITDPHVQMYPAVYGGIVVWVDDRNGNLDIYGFNLTTNQQFPIVVDPGIERFPVIYRDIVVWEDYRDGRCMNWDIYVYNLSTEEEF
jgi:beta propeller repeat protein